METEPGIPTLETKRQLWFKMLGREFENIGQYYPKSLVVEQECPPWVERVEAELGAALMPLTRYKEILCRADVTPKRMGALLGHSCAMAVWTMEWISQDAAKLENIAKSKVDASMLQVADTSESFQFKEWYMAMRRLAKRALSSSVDQSFEDMSEFLLGYSNAFARKPKTFSLGEMGNTTFEIYLFFRFFWRPIERLESVSQLHEVLVKIFGPYRAGELKRTEKICQHIGLHFRKPGRPRACT